MGMFGAVGRALASARTPGADGATLSDKLAYLGSALSDNDDFAEATKNFQGMIGQRAKLAKQQAAQKALEDVFGGGGPSPTGLMSQDTQPPAMGQLPAGVTPQMPTPRRQPSLSDPATQMAILQAAEAGVPGANEALEMLKAQKAEYVNGVRTNPYDANGPAYIPTLDKGQEPLYNSHGQIVGVRNMDGSIKAASEMAGAVKGAEAAAQAPYQAVQTQDRDGRPMTINAARLAAEGGFAGQSPADRIRAEALASGEAARANAVQDRAASAPSQTAALDQMERLLPDVISGFGAGPRLEIDRMKAAAGDQQAQKRVAATETFINQGRVLVSSIIKTFGANPTEGERKFAERMSGADAQLNPETLKEGIRLQRERIARDQAAAGVASPRRSGAARVAPPTAVQYLRANPHLAAAFDAKYGAGAAARALGQ